jgi:hypothetical protein
MCPGGYLNRTGEHAARRWVRDDGASLSSARKLRANNRAGHERRELLVAHVARRPAVPQSGLRVIFSAELLDVVHEPEAGGLPRERLLEPRVELVPHPVAEVLAHAIPATLSRIPSQPRCTRSTS